MEQRESWQIVRSATEAFDNPDQPKFSIAGPDIRMASGAVIAIAMTLNEPCTNTTKFGALSVPKGASTSPGHWTTDPALAPDMDRNERRGSPSYRKRSFGTRLIETLGKQLRATCS